MVGLKGAFVCSMVDKTMVRLKGPLFVPWLTKRWLGCKGPLFVPWLGWRGPLFVPWFTKTMVGLNAAFVFFLGWQKLWLGFSFLTGSGHIAL